MADRQGSQSSKRTTPPRDLGRSVRRRSPTPHPSKREGSHPSRRDTPRRDSADKARSSSSPPRSDRPRKPLVHSATPSSLTTSSAPEASSSPSPRPILASDATQVSPAVAGALPPPSPAHSHISVLSGDAGGAQAPSPGTALRTSLMPERPLPTARPLTTTSLAPELPASRDPAGLPPPRGGKPPRGGNPPLDGGLTSSPGTTMDGVLTSPSLAAGHTQGVSVTHQVYATAVAAPIPATGVAPPPTNALFGVSDNLPSAYSTAGSLPAPPGCSTFHAPQVFWNPYAWPQWQSLSPYWGTPWSSRAQPPYPMPPFRPPPGLGSMPSLPPLPPLPSGASATFSSPAGYGGRVESPPRTPDGRGHGGRVESPPRAPTPAPTLAPAATPATQGGHSPVSCRVSITGVHSGHDISARTRAVPPPVLPAAHVSRATSAPRAATRADAHLVDASDQSPTGGSGEALIDQPFEDGSLLSAYSADDDLPPVLSRETTPQAGLLDVLAEFTDSVVSVEEQPTELSYAERALGSSAARPSSNHVRESPIARRALTAARRRFLAPSTAEFSRAGLDNHAEEPQLSQSLGLLAPPTGPGPCRSVNWQFTSFRPAGHTLHVSDEEKARLGISRAPPPSAPVTEKTLRTFELLAQRGLATMCKMDTLLAALATVTGDKDESSSSGSPSEEATHVLLSALAECIQYTTDNLATLYFDSVLLRRDRMLSASPLPPAAKAAARSVPIAQPLLFGSAAGQVVQDAAAQASSALALRASVAQATQRRRPPLSGAPPHKAPRRSTPARPAPRQAQRPRPRPPPQSSRQQRGQRRASFSRKHPQ